MAISDVLRRAIGKCSPSTLSNSINFNEDPATTHANSNGWNKHTRNNIPSLAHTHTFNTYTPETVEPRPRFSRFSSRAKWMKSKTSPVDMISGEKSLESFKANMNREKVKATERERGREKEREKRRLDERSAEKARKKREKKSRRPKYMERMESYSWRSASVKGSLSMSPADEEEQSDVSPGNTRNNSRAEERRPVLVGNDNPTYYHDQVGKRQEAGDAGLADLKRLML